MRALLRFLVGLLLAILAFLFRRQKPAQKFYFPLAFPVWFHAEEKVDIGYEFVFPLTFPAWLHAGEKQKTDYEFVFPLTFPAYFRR